MCVYVNVDDAEQCAQVYQVCVCVCVHVCSHMCVCM
jgi:hypothetical protein